MRTLLLCFISLLWMASGTAQDNDRRLLRGKVLYRDVSVPNENVINITTERATITNNDGQFAIAVKEGDELAFTAINYQIEVVKITAEILKRNRLVVEVNEKVTELEEVVVTPEDQERFLKVKNEEFEQYEYETDRSTEVENIALSQSERGMRDGINFVNIFRALTGANQKEEASRPKLKLSEVLRTVYDDRFFVVDLKVPQDQIDAFLVYCDSRLPEQSLLRKDHEFQLIDFLVTNSKNFRETLNEEK